MSDPTFTYTDVDGFAASTVVATYIPGKIVTTDVECAGELRWNGKKLEQKWRLIGYGTTGAVEKIDYEWREVPRAVSTNEQASITKQEA